MPEPDGVRWVRMRLLRSSSRWTGLAEDITSDRMSLERMEYERDHDVLTELYNRRAFKRMALALLARGPQAACVGALVMLDLDNLKYINDTYGHDMGDAYIRCMAASLPSPDGERCLVARMSDDEFFVLFHGYDTQEEVRGQIALLRQRMTRASLTLPDGVRQPVRASGGVAWYPADSDRFDELVRYADFAMYQVKNSGKGEFAEFDGEAYRRDAYLVQSRGVLHRLLEQRLVDYHFQPIVEVSTGRIFCLRSADAPPHAGAVLAAGRAGTGAAGGQAARGGDSYLAYGHGRIRGALPCRARPGGLPRIHQLPFQPGHAARGYGAVSSRIPGLPVPRRAGTDGGHAHRRRSSGGKNAGIDAQRRKAGAGRLRQRL